MSKTKQPATVGRFLDDRLSLILFLLAFVFTGLALWQLGLVNQDLRAGSFIPVLGLATCGGLAAYFLHLRQPPGDQLLLPLIYLMTGLGLALIARLAPSFVKRQLVWLAIATACLLLVTLLPKNLNWLRRYKYTWLIGGLLLLATTLVFGVNPSGFGARLWLRLGGIYFQPSEPLKLLMVVFLAGYMADRHRQLAEAKAYIGRLAIPHPTYYGPMLLMWGFSIILLVWQRDLGAALLFFGTFIGMLYVATGQVRYVWAGAALLFVAGSIGYYLFDVVRLRIEAFLNPWLDPSGRSFQIVQSLLAFASGGVLGQGLGQGLPTAIPVVHTDFVFAAIGEEYGLLGSLAVLTCFALLVGRACFIFLRSDRAFEQLLAAGIGTMLGLQTLAITAGTLKLMPLTGVTLPFVSYGGSSLITSYIMVGILIFIARQPAKPNRDYAPLVAHNLRLAQALLTGFLVVAGGLILWHIAAAPFLLDREDNPRRVIAEQQIDRGRLLTADGISVAETLINNDGLAERHYPYPSLSSMTGFYSLRYGVGGTEATFDPLLRGTAGRTAAETWWDQLLHRPLVGQDVRLTIHLPAQVAADVMLGEQEGAVVVMEIDTGAILVMSSHPSYDPNQLDERWDSLRKDEAAPLLNRATQGLFPVGDLARLFSLIGLAEAGAILPTAPLTASLPELVAPLSEAGYLATAHQLGLTRPIQGIPSQPGLLPAFEEEGTPRDLAVTPLHLARVVAALELDGQLPTPILSPIADNGRSLAMGPDTARYLRSVLPQVEQQIIGLSGQATPNETGRPVWLDWFVGLAPATAFPLDSVPAMLPFDPSQDPPAPAATPQLERAKARYVVVAVVVTDEPESGLAFRIAEAPLRAVLGR